MFKNILLTNDGTISLGSIDTLVAMMAEAAVEITCCFVIPSASAAALVQQPGDTTIPLETPPDRRQVDQWMKVVRKAAAVAKVRCQSYCISSDHPRQTIYAAAERYGCDAIAIAGSREKGVTLVNLQI